MHNRDVTSYMRDDPMTRQLSPGPLVYLIKKFLSYSLSKADWVGLGPLIWVPKN